MIDTNILNDQSDNASQENKNKIKKSLNTEKKS